MPLDRPESPLPHTPFPIAGPPDGLEQQPAVITDVSTPDLPRVSARKIWLMVIAQFGIFTAQVTPIAFSLAVRVEDLAPGQEGYLGVILGVAGIAGLPLGPIIGMMSDRTRSRFGRRRPYALVGAVFGMIGLLVIAFAPNLVAVGVGWFIASFGWGMSIGVIGWTMADLLPESQRGKVGGLIGFAGMFASIFGVLLGGLLATQTLLLFLVPGLVGAVAVVIFALFIGEKDSRGMVAAPRISAKVVFGSYIFNPRTYRDFSWNWLGRFFFYFGLTLNTTFTAFFYASRLGLEVTEIGGIVALIGGIGIIGTMGGAIGGGFLSDKVRRRKVFVVTAAVLFTLGAVAMAFAPGFPLLMAGSFLCNVGIGVFASVDQALTLDVLPERQTDAGRFLALNSFSDRIPQAVAPVIAPIFLAIGMSTGEQNYPLLYVVAGAFTLIGGLVILRVRSVR